MYINKDYKSPFSHQRNRDSTQSVQISSLCIFLGNLIYRQIVTGFTQWCGVFDPCSHDTK